MSSIPSSQQMALWVTAIAQSRDQEAFGRLFSFFAPRIYQFLLKSGCDSGTAEEITQDTLSTLWNKAHLFDSNKSSIGTWLFRVARNRKIDLLRRQRENYVAPDDPSLDQLSVDAEDETLDVKKYEMLVSAAIQKLPEEQSKLIFMSFYDELSHSEIAAKTGIPLGTIKSRIRVAFVRLRKEMAELNITTIV